jgi:hypothetical protein
MRGARTVAEVAGQLGWSESKLSRIETAHTGIRNRDLDKLLDVYDASDQIRARIRAIAAQSRQKAWWEAYGDALPNAYETYIGFETEAVSLREYNATVVPGLLQTDEYAHAVLSVGPSDDPDVVAQHLSVRMARRAVLNREPPLELQVILDEAVVRREVGGREVMQRQIRWLVDVARRPMISLRILPFSAGAHPGLAGTFAILDFAPRSEPPLVYCDGMTGGVFRNRHDELQGYEEAFAALQAAALDPDESEDFLMGIERDGFQ